MNAELEALLKALDAFKQAEGDKAQSLLQLYEALLDEAVSKRSGLAKDTLHRVVLAAYRSWVRAQASNPSTLPPKA